MPAERRPLGTPAERGPGVAWQALALGPEGRGSGGLVTGFCFFCCLCLNCWYAFRGRTEAAEESMRALDAETEKHRKRAREAQQSYQRDR